jgi:Tetratricopeptide repeat/Protein of unknown function (DUF3108)
MTTRLCEWATGGMFCLVASIGLLAATGPAVAATPSELLQKAIYTEETVGDLDAAMKLYEQVIAEGTTAQEAAAQAQFRIALIYEKQGRDADARAAFEKLIADFPNATKLIAEARQHLPSGLKLLPTPWVLGERMQLNMKLPSGLPIGTMIYMVDGAKHDGKEVTRCSTRGLVTINNASSYSWVLCDSDDFKPFASFWKHSLLGEASATYGDDSVTIKNVKQSDPQVIDFTPPAFDNEQCAELFRRLPLAVGYKTTINIIPTLTGTKIPLGMEVSDKETVTVPAGTFECYKLVLNIGQTFWIANDEHRYLVRFAAGGVTADLTKVWQAKPDEQQTVTNDQFTLTLPSGWLSYEANQQDKPAEVNYLLLDPQAEATTEVAVRPKATLKEAERDSTQAWTESFVNDIKKVYPDFHVVDPGMTETKVSGQPATEIIAEFTDNGTKMRSLGVAVIGENSAATLRFTAKADEFDSLRKDFDAIVESFQLN